MSSLPLFEFSEANELPIGAHYVRVKNFNSKDASSTIKNFYQIGPKLFDTNTLFYILDILELIAKEPVYDMLRNKEQLAYYVSFDLYTAHGHVGYTIIVNSQETRFSADYVDERIENVRRELLTIIERMSLDDFEIFKNTLAKSKWIDYENRVKGFQFNWSPDEEILQGLLGPIRSILKITKAQLLEFYRTHLDAANQRKFSVQVIGNANASESDVSSCDIDESLDELTYVNFTGKPKGIFVEDVMEFRSSLPEYRFYVGEQPNEESIYDNDEEYEDEGANVSNRVNASAVIHSKIVYCCWFLCSSFNVFY